MQMIAYAEDVGRHNALDKVIGKVFMEGMESRGFCRSCHRGLSYELVQKAARAGIELMVGISRPTALAVELANRSTIWSRGESSYAGQDRIL
jgi:FdhD protein